MTGAAMETVGSVWYWVVFGAFVVGMLVLDLGVFHRRAHAVSVKEAAIWSVVWIGLALGFGGFVLARWGAETGEQWITGYVIEKALSVDNLFVFYVLFQTLRVAPEVQHRLLFWGIIGALVMRFGMIWGGTWLLQTVHWVVYVFAAILIVSGLKMLRRRDDDADPRQGRVWRTLERWVRTTREPHGAKLFARENGALRATPLFLVLVVIELSDLMFAVDSILAIFAITEDPFIIFSSNVFAVMGLRSLYFVLAGLATRFDYLQPGLALVLVFVGIKMAISSWVHVPVLVSLGVVAFLLAGSVVASMLKNRWSRERSVLPPGADDGDELRERGGEGGSAGAPG